MNKLKLNFNEEIITFYEATKKYKNLKRKPLSKLMLKYWKKCKQGQSFSSIHPMGSYFNTIKIMNRTPCNTLTTKYGAYLRSDIPGQLNMEEYRICGTFPIDYNFKNVNAMYLIGMSVPPVMIAQIANQVYLQLLKGLNE